MSNLRPQFVLASTSHRAGFSDDVFDGDEEETSDDHNDATTDTPSPILDGHQVIVVFWKSIQIHDITYQIKKNSALEHF